MAGLGAGLGARSSAAFEAGWFRPLASPLRPARSGKDTHYSPPIFSAR
jgi:methionyl aminopeptidase